MSSDYEWAESLVGRDWEIYWDNGENDDVDKNNLETDKKKGVSCEMGENIVTEKKFDSDNENDITDWYDATIISYKSAGTGLLSFDIKFVGEDQIYTMGLTPSLVRPSGRAWLKRTKSLLIERTMDKWEKSLSVDTSTLDDQMCIQELKNKLLHNPNRHIPPRNHGKNSLTCPTVQQVNNIHRYQYEVQVQIYLSGKLTVVEEHGEKEENEITEKYLNFLVICLEEVNKSCEWYLKCWNLILWIESIDEVEVSPLELESLRREFVERGRIEILKMINLDIAPSAAKRIIPHTNFGVRRTKRRRVQRGRNPPISSVSSYNTTSNMNNDSNNEMTDGNFFNSEVFYCFAKEVKEKNKRWPVKLFLEMLGYVICHIQESVLCWTQHADILLFGKKELDISDERHSALGKEDEIGEKPGIEEGEIFYTYNDIKLALDRAHSCKILRKFNISHWTSQLSSKIKQIEEFELEAWNIFLRIPDEVEESPRNADPVLTRLCKLRERVSSPMSFLANVNPLARNVSSAMTKKAIEDACKIREWIIDLTHIEKHRERISFVEDVISRSSRLPCLPCLPDDFIFEKPVQTKIELIRSRANHLISNLFPNNSHIVEQYQQSLIQDPVQQSDSENLQSIDGIDKALESLALEPTLSLVEEKLSVRKDILLWRKDVAVVLMETSKRIPFDLIDQYYKSFMGILAGSSTHRMQLAKGLRKNEAIEREICQFACKDVNNIVNDISTKIEKIYSRAAKWKKRAEGIIYSLRTYGNIFAGEPISPVKNIAMVDIRRLVDLIEEYDNFHISMESIYSRLQAVYKQALSWSKKVTTIIGKERDLLTMLIVCHGDRPRGIIVDPSRHVFDLLLDLLKWHNKVKCVTTKLQSIIEGGKNNLYADINLLTLEGIEVIQEYSKQWDFTDISVTSSDIANFAAETGQVFKTLKRLSLSKIEASPIGKKLCKRIFSSSFDLHAGHPLFCMIYMLWAFNVKALVSRKTAFDSKMRPTLKEAIALARKEPIDNSVKYPDLLLNSSLKGDIFRFRCLLSEGEKIEEKARMLCSLNQISLNGLLEGVEKLHKYQASLKEMQKKIKLLKQGEGGLLLDPLIEKNIDQRWKETFWLLRTLDYPLLYNGIDSDDDDDDDNKIPIENRLPWGVLVSLFERAPSIGDGVMSNLQRVVLHVQELYNAANMWQQEVSSLLSISIRGSKRRNVGIQELENNGRPKLSFTQLSDLSKDPILLKVAMPRESLVQEVLQKANKFEQLMYNLLGKDFHGVSADKAPYPVTSSLIGLDGKFHLYRLTGSQLYGTLKSSVEEITHVCSEIAADTAGEKAFGWIRRCVEWIQSIDDAITEASPFGGTARLFIYSKDATDILLNGNQFLLDVSDDIRKILSTYKIILSTNKQSEKLSVNIGKGGAHHSVGGTFIKWCSLVFDWIRNDNKKKNLWEQQAHDIHLSYKFHALMNQKYVTQTELNDAYQHYQRMRIHLHKGQESLVLTPDNSVIDTLQSRSDELIVWVQNQIFESEGILSLKLAKLSPYEDSKTAIADREEFLDSLLTRRQIYSSTKNSTALLLSSEDNVRSRARFKIEKMMRKGMRMLGFKVQGACDVSLLCSIKAFEIEDAAFSEFRPDGQKPVSKEYTEKLVLLHGHLDPSRNPTLCARYLTNKISSEKLVLMSPDEMIFNSIRKQNFCADILNSTSESVITTSKMAQLDNNKKKSNCLRMLSSSCDTTKASPDKTQLSLQTLLNKVSKTNVTLLPEVSLNQDDLVDKCRIPCERDFAVIKENTNQCAKEIIKNVTSPISPGPSSLVRASSSPLSNAMTHSRGVLLCHGNGDKYNVAVSDTKAVFQVKLYIEEETIADFEDLLPHTIKIKRRSKVDEYTSFLSLKVKSGNSTILLLRMSICGKADDYKRFYKDYESKKRIAMCKLGEDTLFLVTPKYHSACKEIRDKFSSRSSSYGVLVKRLQFKS